MTSDLRHQLARLRQDYGISQAELARRLGVTQTAVSYWESGCRQPGLDDVERWAAALGATPTLLHHSPRRRPVAEHIKIRVHIGMSFAANADHEETVTGPTRTEWDAMSEGERDTYLDGVAQDTLANYLDLNAYVED